MLDKQKQFALLRMVFGAVWAVDAYFKWQPKFFSDFASYLSGSLDGQSAVVQQWIGFWIKLVGVNPHFFAYVVAIAETLIAAALLSGLLTRVAIGGGILLSLVIWTTAEAFGGPYEAGTTDIGSAIIYVLVFAALYIGASGETWSIDALLKKRKMAAAKTPAQG